MKKTIMVISAAVIIAGTCYHRPVAPEPKQQPIVTASPIPMPPIPFLPNYKFNLTTPTPAATPQPTPEVATPLHNVTRLSTKATPAPPSKSRKMVVTAYTAGYESTGKRPGDKEYAITASGVRAVKGVTVAAGRNLPIGTKIWIPEFADWTNEGIFTVQDRGGKIGSNHIDVYFGETHSALNAAYDFGLQHLDVYILNEEDRF